MRITVVGTGYVGLVSGTCFAQVGNKVTCVDVDAQKIDNLKKGVIPIYEPGLEQMVKANISNGNLSFTTDLAKVVNQSEFLFIAVGTPMGEDGSADLKYVMQVVSDVAKIMTKPLIFVNKSTVPIGTADKIKQRIEDILKERGIEISFEIVSNPEFLKEGNAVSDFMKPDRVVIGANSTYALEQMKLLYQPFFLQYDRFITMDIRSAEMTKYASNAMLATKISFMNEIANLCERTGADVNKVRLGIGSDNRIGYSFIYPGCGYGGSCFPKDVQALQQIAYDYDYKAELIEAVQRVNNRQKLHIVTKIQEKFGENLSGKTFAIWGLSFKPETDDMREAPSIYVIKELIKKGACIVAYDPQAKEQAQNFYLKDLPIIYASDKYQALDKADALVLLTEWKEFRVPDFELISQKLKEKVIFDGRNQYHSFDLKKIGLEYIQIGVKNN